MKVIKSAFIILFSICFFTGSSLALGKSTKSSKRKSELSKSAVRDAEFSFYRGDLFRSFKLYTLLEKKNPSLLFQGEHFIKYLKTIRALKGKSALRQICTQAKGKGPNTNSVLFSCARELYIQGDYRTSNKILTKISKPQKSKISILRASNYLALGAPEKCTQELLKIDRKVDTKDLGSLLEARCFMSQRLFAQASAIYRTVKSDSIHYIDSLYELAWAQFKAREIGEAKTSIDVVLSSYSEFEEDRNQISQKEYFDLRYLKAYLGLVQSGASNVSDDMDIALGDIRRIQKQTKYTVSDFTNILKGIRKGKLSKNQLISEGGDLAEILQFSSNWGGVRDHENLETNLDMLVALSLELKENRKTKAVQYKKDLQFLLNYYSSESLVALKNAYKGSRSSLSGFVLRIELAKRKQNILQATKGIRNLDQAKKIYSKKAGHLNDLVGDL